jgi:hypothetical protein
MLCDIENAVGYTSAAVGQRNGWAIIISSVENFKNYCKYLRRKRLFSALYESYKGTLIEVKGLLETKHQDDGSKEDRSRKRHTTSEAACTTIRAALHPTSLDATGGAKEVATLNFYAPRPLCSSNMDTDAATTPTEEVVAGKSGRPPPIILTSATNLLQLQKLLQGVAKQTFEFRATRNRSWVRTKDIAGFHTVKANFKKNAITFHTF